MTDPNTADNTATPHNEPVAPPAGAESQPVPEAEQTDVVTPEAPEATEAPDAPAPEVAEASAESQPAPEVVETAPEVAEAPASAEPTAEAETGAEAAAAPRPTAPKPGSIPTPAALAQTTPRAATAAPPIIATDHSASAAFGRVDDNGAVYVRTAEGEREVGSYPGASNEQALTYFARKYDELFASAVLLEQRVEQPEVPSKDVQDALKKLAAQVKDAAVVGDLAALDTKLTHIETLLAAKRETEQVARLKAREEAKVERERIVAEAEEIAGQPDNRIQWKTSGARMRELLDQWKQHQRSSTRLDRETETALWQRFSAARNRFDKSRRAHFASLDAAHADAKTAKERLVAEAEALSTSTDWAATAGAFKRLMDQWRNAGRASRTDDDRLWSRFKAAQDAFFAAKDQVVAAEEEEFRGNLAVKEQLLAEAQSILPVTDLDKAKAQLRAIQDKWEAAGKVPRSDMDRVEKGLRRIEQTVRDAEDHKWKATNPEVAARAQGMVEQLERAVADLEADLAKAEASGNAAKIAKARDALEARRAWLEQAKAGVQEFGG
jgi:hypothetical protein